MTIGEGPPSEIGIFSKRSLKPFVEPPKFIDDLPPNEQVRCHKSNAFDALIGHDAIALCICRVTLDQPLKTHNTFVLEILVGIRQPMKSGSQSSSVKASTWPLACLIPRFLDFAGPLSVVWMYWRGKLHRSDLALTA